MPSWINWGSFSNLRKTDFNQLTLYLHYMSELYNNSIVQ